MTSRHASMTPRDGRFEFKFDWYQATIPNVSEDAVIEAICEATGADLQSANGAPQYAQTLAFKDHFDQQIATISFGGANAAAGPHVKTTGFHAQEMVPLIRQHFPVHRVSRLDSAMDVTGEGVFDYVYACLDTIFGTMGIARRDYGFASPENGRTYYLGSPKSPMQVRAYEKGKKERNEGVPYADLNWVRVECQYRPRSAEKSRCATLCAQDVFGYTRWGRTLLRDLFQMDAEPIRQERPMNNELEQKIEYLRKTHARTLQQWARGKSKEELLAFFEPGPLVSNRRSLETI